jgi:hypothetical protein
MGLEQRADALDVLRVKRGHELFDRRQRLTATRY